MQENSAEDRIVDERQQGAPMPDFLWGTYLLCLELRTTK